MICSDCGSTYSEGWHKDLEGNVYCDFCQMYYWYTEKISQKS